MTGADLLDALNLSAHYLLLAACYAVFVMAPLLWIVRRHR